MAALTVEHLKVMAASRACLRIQLTYWVGGLMVEHLKVLMVEHLKVLISRAPKGDGGLNSRACLRIQLTYWVGGLMVEHLKVLMVEHLKVLISRAPCRVRVYLLGAPSQISNQRATKV